MHKPGWGIRLTGDVIDLGYWESGLQPPFDPWIEIESGERVLRSESFDELASGEDVRVTGIALIDRLNGAFAISHQARSVKLNGVVEFTATGKVNRHIFVAHATFEIRGVAANITVETFGPDGKPSPTPPPQPSPVQSWSSTAEQDPVLDDALIYFGKATDWFDLYKALESLELKAGGKQAFLALGWASASQIKLLKRTANWARHAKRKNPPPPQPMDFAEARTLVAYFSGAH